MSHAVSVVSRLIGDDHIQEHFIYTDILCPALSL